MSDHTPAQTADAIRQVLSLTVHNTLTLRPHVCWAATWGLRGTMAWDSNMDDNEELMREVDRAQGLPGPTRSCPVSLPAECPARPANVQCPPDIGESGAGGNAGIAAGGTSSGTGGGTGSSCTYTVKAVDTFWAIALSGHPAPLLRLSQRSTPVFPRPPCL